MGVHNLQSDLQGADFTTEFVGFEIPTVGKMFCWGATVPADAATGYGKGCIFIHNDSANTTGAATDRMFVNKADTTSCNFNSISISAD